MKLIKAIVFAAVSVGLLTFGASCAKKSDPYQGQPAPIYTPAK
ncbi:MAG: hypothetical protein AAF555_09200 [Verrucomicrobiota bacterium]